MHLPAKDSSYCHQTLPTGIHPIIPAIDTLSSFRNQFDQIPWATGSIKIYPAKEGAYRHRCSEDDGEPEWRVMRSSKGSWRPVAWRVEAVEGPEAVGARPRSPTAEELARRRRAGAGRGAPRACVVGVRGQDVGGRARGAGSLRRRRAGAGARGRGRDAERWGLVWAVAGPAAGPAAWAAVESLGSLTTSEEEDSAQLVFSHVRPPIYTRDYF